MTNQNNKPQRNKKRKNEEMSSNNVPRTSAALNPEHEDMLDLSLGSPNYNTTLTLSPSHPQECQYSTSTSPSPLSDHWQLSLSLPEDDAVPPHPNPSQPPGVGAGEGKSETIPPPYEWATDRRATVHSLEHLVSKKIEKIKGDVKCKRCECEYEIELDLRERFWEVKEFILKNKGGMHERAPEVWKNPRLPTCRYCHQENSAKPVIGSSKKRINWLFLLLAQLLGCCTLEQLKYFCKHTKNHRTGAKDRLLYLAYLTLCKQLHPTAPLFHR